MTKEELKPKVINFGCRLNAYESEAIKEILEGDENKEKQNLIVFNSCAVTSNAERQLRQSIRKMAKENPDSKLIITGCAAQIDPQKYAGMKEVFRVIGNEDKFKKTSYFGENSAKIENSSQKDLEKDSDFESPTHHQDKIFAEENYTFIDESLESKILVNDIMSVKETSSHMISGFENQSRAFVQIQNGCNHRCTFCIIPYGRGNSRSVAFGEVVKQIKYLVDNGYKEVVLTGVDISDYGKDLLEGLTFSKMVKRLLKLIPDLPRLRISSIDVAEIDEDFLDLLKNEPRLMPYLHISLQAGDDMVLKRMKRRHNRAQVLEFCQKARELRPDITFGSDIIAGFPTESDENFQNSLNLIHEAGIIFNHIFPYSIRKGTPAAKMPQIADKIKKSRAQALRNAGQIELHKFLDMQIGKTQSIVLEENNIGRCENFAAVKIQNAEPNLKTGEIFQVKIIDRDGDNLIGNLL
jgi:threonylcarbamoyladenosine tRNA methylthiotransferase MtaB